MTDTTWATQPTDQFYDDGDSLLNWSLGDPGPADTAFFGTSTITDITILPNSNKDVQIKEWVFNSWAPNYSFTIVSGSVFYEVDFAGAGIVANGGSVTLLNDVFGTLVFFNDSTAGKA